MGLDLIGVYICVVVAALALGEIVTVVINDSKGLEK